MTTEHNVVEVEWTSGDLVHSLCSKQTEPKQLNQGCAQLGFECLQAWRLHVFGQPCWK